MYFSYPITSERPRDFRLTPGHPLWKQSKFRGLGWQAGSVYMRDGDGQPGYVKNDGILTGMNPATNWMFDPELGRNVLEFDGVNDYVLNASAPGIPTSGPATIAAWFKHPTAAAVKYCLNFSTYGGSATSLLAIALRGASTVSPYQQYYGFIGAGGYYTSVSPSVNEWHHICFVFNDPSLRQYVNGRLVGTVAFDGSAITPPSSNTFTGPSVRLGYLDTAGLYFAGRMADPVCFSRALAVTEIGVLADRSDTMLSGGLYDPRRTVVSLAGISGGGPAVSPWWYVRRQSQIIGSGLGV